MTVFCGWMASPWTSNNAHGRRVRVYYVIDQALEGASPQDRPDLSTTAWIPFLLLPEKTHLDLFSLPQTLSKVTLLLNKNRNQ